MMFVCPKHPGGQAIKACPHALEAFAANETCPKLEYRSYAALDPELDGMELGALLCSRCLAELPPEGTRIQDVDEFLDTASRLFLGTCAGCFEEWRGRAAQVLDETCGFLDRSKFAFVDSLESAWPAIRDEYLALPAERFDPWVQRQMHGGGWSVFGLYARGQPIPGGASKCRATMQALAQIPGLSMAGFSRLAPRTHVTPHVGWAKSVYRLHLPLVVPPGCRLRVGPEMRSWETGRCLIFDDTVEHEAWNDSDEPRGVLLVDFLRPGIQAKAEDHVPEEVREYLGQLQART
jgi:beta-hydroxylase